MLALTIKRVSYAIAGALLGMLAVWLLFRADYYLRHMTETELAYTLAAFIGSVLACMWGKLK